MANPTKAILGPDGRPLPPSSRPSATLREIRSRYDSAQTTTENSNHWGNADALSAAAANSKEVRTVLRNRARYERDNNGYASGMVETLANDVIGTGPRLHLDTPDADANARCADAFEEWTAAVGLAEKLRTMREAKAVDGEAFALLVSNPATMSRVTLDLFLVETDQVSTPDLFFVEPKIAVDGIRFDAYGNPSEYHLLKDHPGDTYVTSWGYEYDRLPASLVLHWFKARRPGQRRGVPEITPVLDLFANLRRYTKACVSSAEIAALFAVLLKSLMPPEDAATSAPPFDTREVTRGMMTVLPDGYDVAQLKAEQPTTTYPMFKSEILNEIARPLNMPYNVAAGNSSGYNYASGRLDHQVYHRMIGVDRYHLETHILDRVFRAWLEEARLADPGSVAGLALPAGPIRRLPRHQWFWDGFAHVDPGKEAAAQTQRLANRTTTLADEWAAEGHDWRAKARQQAAERAYFAQLGLPYPGDAPAADDTTDDAEGGDDAA